eukprot:IDg15488t1
MSVGGEQTSWDCCLSAAAALVYLVLDRQAARMGCAGANRKGRESEWHFDMCTINLRQKSRHTAPAFSRTSPINCAGRLELLSTPPSAKYAFQSLPNLPLLPGAAYLLFDPPEPPESDRGQQLNMPSSTMPLHSLTADRGSTSCPAMATKFAAEMRRRRPNRRPRPLLSLSLVLLLVFILRRPPHIELRSARDARPEDKRSSDDAERAVLRAAAHNGAVVITTSNYMYREHLRNLQCGLLRLDLPYAPVVFAQDAEIHSFARRSGLASVALSQSRGDDVKPGRFSKVGARSFGHITRQKLGAVARALRAGLDVLITDADIHWCGDALAAARREAPAADVLVMTEADYKTLNSGFYFVRANDRTRASFDLMAALVGFGQHDQDVLNAVLCGAEFGARRVDEPNAALGAAPFRVCLRQAPMCTSLMERA